MQSTVMVRENAYNEILVTFIGESMADWERFRQALTMCKGAGQILFELENLLLDSNFEFTQTDLENNSENKPKWRRTVKTITRKSRSNKTQRKRLA